MQIRKQLGFYENLMSGLSGGEESLYFLRTEDQDLIVDFKHG